MTWVKVCGLSTAADVEVALEAGADAVGFVVAPASPRYVDLSLARGLVRDVPAISVLVTVDMEPSQLLAAATQAGASGVQPHGRHGVAAGAAAAEAGFFVLLPTPMRPGVEIEDPPPGVVPMFDTYRAGTHGGTGETFDWSLLDGVAPPFVLAGGLNAGNVADAVRAVRPWGVDASSGLEAEPGVKDHSKVTAFIREAKQA